MCLCFRSCRYRGSGRKRRSPAVLLDHSGRPATSRPSGGPESTRLRGDHLFSDVAQAFQGLAAYRDQLNQQRMSRAAAMATKLVADLARAVTDQPDMILTDAVCERLGAVLAEAAERSAMDERVGPHHLAEAIPVAAEAAVMAALTATTGSADAWRAPWRVLTALTCVLPHPFNEVVDDTITRLRGLPAGRVLPAAPTGTVVTGTVLWTSDQYGSRFAVAAPIMTAEEPVRWYLWDIDACGHAALTLHSGYYPSSEAALAAWQTGVGQTVSAGAVLAPADDPWLLAALLPVDMGFMRPGGESLDAARGWQPTAGAQRIPVQFQYIEHRR